MSTISTAARTKRRAEVSVPGDAVRSPLRGFENIVSVDVRAPLEPASEHIREGQHLCKAHDCLQFLELVAWHDYLIAGN